MSSESAAIVIKNAIIRAGNFSIIIEDLCIVDGLYVLTGENGSGKSTFLRALLGLIEKSGELTISKKLSFGYMPQNYREALMPWLSAKENLEILGELENDSHNALSQLSFQAQDLEKKPGQLSGGQCQRLVLVRELYSNNNFCVLDEPFSSLDIKTRQRAIELIANYTNKGATAVITSHVDADLISAKKVTKLICERHKENSARVRSLP